MTQPTEQNPEPPHGDPHRDLVTSGDGGGHPVAVHVVLDCEDVRGLAEFYRELLGLHYRKGHETPEPGEDWLVLRNPGGIQLAFQKVESLPRATWPEGPVPQQLHLDCVVPDEDALRAQHQRALALGARLLDDRSDDPDEQLYVYADPEGHPFCIFVGSPPSPAG